MPPSSLRAALSPCTGACAGPSVSFRNKVECILIQSLDDMTESEIQMRWLSKEDRIQIASDMQRTILRMRRLHQECKPIVDEDDFCFHGLEQFQTSTIVKTKASKVKKHLDSILDAQVN